MEIVIGIWAHMTEQFVVLIHILVVGYWLGSELVINSTFRYVCWSKAMPFDERAALMDHVMVMDQHVRYALILQASLGTALGAWIGYFPGGDTLALIALGLGLLWLGFVELTHRRRHDPSGKTLSLIDRLSRAILAGALVVIAAAAFAGANDLPHWLAAKLFLFAGIITSGLVIRIFLMRFFQTWATIKQTGSDDKKEARIREFYVKSTTTLIVLWLFIAGIVWLSFSKTMPLI